MTRNVLAWLEATAQQTPDAVAFADDGGSMTFLALLGRAQAIGSFLAHRIPSQKPVAVFMEKHAGCVAAMLGAVYAGCFYTPVDPAMPQARVEMIFSVLRPAYVICDAKYADKVRASGVRAVAAAEEIGPETDAERLRAIREESIDTDLLYVLFTSGSTGVPKGVSITHRSVIDFIEWACDALAIDGSCRFGNQAPLYFDNSVLDIYCALRTGACVRFIPNKYFLFPANLMQYLNEQQINTIFWVPSALVAVANAEVLAGTPPRFLKRVYFCGEVMPCKQLNVWRRALPDARFVNMYGPTEITDVCTYYPVDRTFRDDDVLPIGRPCANTRVILLEGEICVTGACLSAGYYNAPERTREAFVQNPMRPERMELLYHTGDLGEYNERGELMFLGRKDSQIKRHGFRIELGEVESALLAAADVREGCCFYDEAREEIVCAYAGGAERRELKAWLRAKLPAYMVPGSYLRCDALPKTGNGKIDRVRVKREYGRDTHLYP